MRNSRKKIGSIFHHLGSLLITLGVILLFPLVVVAVYGGRSGDGWQTVWAFVIPAVLSAGTGLILRGLFKADGMDVAASMILCALGWIVISVFGALPFVIGIQSGYIDALFEAMSGFTTTGITVYSGLDQMCHSILFWRSLTQWLGGLGILSFFLVVAFHGSGAHHMLSAESHKISSGRLAPGIFSTLKILWAVYSGLTLSAAAVYILEGMTIFDGLCHALTTLSTGGFSPHDASIDFYRLSGHAHFVLIEYTVAFFMMLGGINFLVHYRVLTGDVKALWDNLEIRFWWRLLGGFTLFLMVDHFLKNDGFKALFSRGSIPNLKEVEQCFRYSIFQVISLMTTTGFGTKDIGSGFFPTASRQLFMVMMVIGGCVGSTGGGFKVLRIAILNRLMFRELFKLRTSDKASGMLVIDKKPVSDDEIHRVSALFFTWLGFLLIGGVITAVFSQHGPFASLSGMFSAVGNIGPCYISVDDMIRISPVVKITYIIGMLAGRLEIIPVLLLFSRKAWK